MASEAKGLNGKWQAYLFAINTILSKYFRVFRAYCTSLEMKRQWNLVTEFGAPFYDFL